MSGIERTEVINEQIRLCGYFVIITSEKMTAAEALNLYKSRDDSEKTFRGDKSYLGAHCERVYSDESIETKIFIGFVATIIRNRIVKSAIIVIIGMGDTIWIQLTRLKNYEQIWG